jgi:hypothetical protein
VARPTGSVTHATSPLWKYFVVPTAPFGVVTFHGRPAGAYPPSAAVTVVPSVYVVVVARPLGYPFTTGVVTPVRLPLLS